MTVSAKPLFEAGFAAAAETAVYTAPTGVRTIIDKLTGFNGSAAAATLTVKLVPSAGAAGTSNVTAAKTLQPGEAYTFPEVVGHVLAPGDTISLLAGTAGVIVTRGSGREVS